MIEKCCIERLKKENEGLREDIETLEDEKEQYRQDYNRVAKECDEWHIKAHMAWGDNTFLKNTIKELEKENKRLNEEYNKFFNCTRINKEDIDSLNDHFADLAILIGEEVGELLQAISKINRYWEIVIPDGRFNEVELEIINKALITLMGDYNGNAKLVLQALIDKVNVNWGREEKTKRGDK